MSTPLEQFQVSPLISLEFGSFDLSFTNSSLAMVTAVGGAMILFNLSLAASKLIPLRRQSFVEMIFMFVLTMVKDNLGQGPGERYFPIVFVLFTFILFCNLLGLVPYTFTVTTHFIVTFALSVSIFVWVTILAFYTNGLHFLKFFLPEGIPGWLAPMLVCIEILSYLARPLSLGIRLFANMMSGHTLFAIIAGFSYTMLQGTGLIYLAGYVPIVFLVVFTALELAICCIQAYVFAILTVLYLKDSLYMH